MTTMAEWRNGLVRPVAIVTALALHAAILMGVTLPKPQITGVVENIEITIAPQQGDATPDATPTESTDSVAQAQAQPDAKPDPTPPEVKPEPTPPPPPPPEAVEEKPVPVAAEAPKREVEDAPLIARRLAEQREKRLEKLREKREEERQEKLEERREEHKRQVQAQRAAAQSAHHARAGIANGSTDSGASRATYGARVIAEIRHHQIHAASTGSVRVAFSVGAGGHVSGASVIGSSGDGALDATALRIVRSCHPGPPPGGSFSGSATINFR